MISHTIGYTYNGTVMVKELYMRFSISLPKTMIFGSFKDLSKSRKSEAKGWRISYVRKNVIFLAYSSVFQSSFFPWLWISIDNCRLGLPKIIEIPSKRIRYKCCCSGLRRLYYVKKKRRFVRVNNKCMCIVDSRSDDFDQLLIKNIKK